MRGGSVRAGGGCSEQAAAVIWSRRQILNGLPGVLSRSSAEHNSPPVTFAKAVILPSANSFGCGSTCALVSLLRSFFQDGLKTADKLKQYIEKLAADLYNVNTSC